MRFPSLALLVERAAAVARRFPLTLVAGLVAATAAIIAVDGTGDDDWARLGFVAALGLPATIALRLLAERGRWSSALRVLAPALLEVEDDGPGIPEDEHQKVFERFYRRGAQGSGAGLGLAIVGEICRAHQAQISLHQVRPHGLRVRVEFPLGGEA